MRFFVDTYSNPELEGQGEGFKYGVTNCYLELEYPVNDYFLVIYYIPRNSNYLVIATCWERAFDEILENLDNPDYLETISETFPFLSQLLYNGFKEKYSEGALIQLEDFDTGEPKWFLISVSGNVNLENPEQIFGNKTNKVAELVIEKSLELLQELNENEPNLVNLFLKKAARGVTAVGILAIASWLGIDLNDTRTSPFKVL